MEFCFDCKWCGTSNTKEIATDEPIGENDENEIAVECDECGAVNHYYFYIENID